MLEKHYSWTDILVEPNRSFHTNIASCRTARLDSRAAASVSCKGLCFEEFFNAGEHSRIFETVRHKINSAVLKYCTECHINRPSFRDWCPVRN